MKRKKLKKEERENIYNKYNGRCAYCGSKIEYKDMQIDHVVPQAHERRLDTGGRR